MNKQTPIQRLTDACRANAATLQAMNNTPYTRKLKITQQAAWVAALQAGIVLLESGATEDALIAISYSVYAVAVPAPKWDGKSQYAPKWAR